MTHEIRIQLDVLAEHQEDRATLAAEKDGARDAVIPPDVKARLDEIDHGYDNKIKGLDEMIAELTNQIKTSVMDHGSNVEANRLKAVTVSGPTRWDTRGLNGYAVARPEILQFRTVGKPHVRVQKR